MPCVHVHANAYMFLCSLLSQPPTCVCLFAGRSIDAHNPRAATADLPTQAQQEGLQTVKSDRVINAVCTTYCAKWTEFAPHDSSIQSAYKWYNEATYDARPQLT